MIATHQTNDIARRFTQISFIVPLIGILVAHNQSQILTIFLIDSADANDAERS